MCEICVICDMGQVDSEKQTGRITIADNSISHTSREYEGGSGVITFAVINSTIEHNRIHDIGYSGLNFNWPATQGIHLRALE